MAISDEQMNYLVAGLANPATAEEVRELLDLVVSLQTSVNALLDELEARNDAAQTINDSADGFYENLKV